MKRLIYSGILIGMVICTASYLEASVCTTKCKVEDGVICLERRPCQNANDLLLKAAKDCRDRPESKYTAITKLSFIDIFSQVIRLDTGFSDDISQLREDVRYDMETNLLAHKGLNIFIGTKSSDPLTRKELAGILKDVAIEQELGVSKGLTNEVFNINNEDFNIYDVKLYIDEGNGFSRWKDGMDYKIKFDNCNRSMIMLGDNKKGKMLKPGSKLKVSYRIFGREDDIVTKCEVVSLLSNPDIARAIKNTYNPSRPLTKANFADLMTKSLRLDRNIPNIHKMEPWDLYLLETKLLSKRGINIFKGSNPNELLTKEELARVLYNYPIIDDIGTSNGRPNQRFELNNAGFMVYDLHTYVNENKEWNKKDSFSDSLPESEDYVVKLDSGNYASIYFGDGKKGKIPAPNSQIKVTYRLYAPMNLVSEDDIICVLSRISPPVAETYVPPMPVFEFIPPNDGYDDPATHI